MTVPRLEFHHIGIACRELRAAELRYRQLGYETEGESFIDPIQQITGVFMTLSGARIELVAPLSPESPVTGWIARGAHTYHTAYETGDIERSILHLQQSLRAKVTVSPTPAVAFSQRRIAFLMGRDAMLIELIESANSQKPTDQKAP